MRDASRSQNHEAFAAYDLRGGDSRAFSGTATRLSAMGRAWSTPGSRWYREPAVKQQIERGLSRLIAAGYHSGAQPFGNWWDWEIGTPRPLADTICLMLEDLPQSMADDALEAIAYFIPDVRRSAISDTESTGANRVNTARPVMISAVLKHSSEQLEDCAEAISEAWSTTSTGDGFHPDAGFIQHLSVPYTGSYGVELLRDVALLSSLVSGTSASLPRMDALHDLVDRAFLPVIVNGHVLDLVRGRAVSRVRTNGSTTGRTVMASIAELSSTAPAEVRDRWLSTLAGWASAPSGIDLLAGPDVVGALALESLAPSLPADPPPQRSVYFPSMDRLVHRAAGWTAGVAMASSRVSAYECSDTENIWGSRTGNAMRYLFVDGDPEPFNDGFWATLDYSRPPGTTNHRFALHPRRTAEDGSRRPANDWTAGMVGGEVSVAAMHQTGLDGDVPNCRRFSVADSSKLVELISDIETEHGPAVTTIENRMLGENSRHRIVVDGKRVTRELTATSASWAHLEGTGGYLILGDGQLTAATSRRIGSSRQVERSVAEIEPENRITRTWVTLDLIHTATSGAWMLLPGASEAETRRVAAKASRAQAPTILRNDGTAQVVGLSDARTTAAAVWKPSTITCAEGLKIQCSTAVLLLIEHRRGDLRLTIVEPTQQLDSITLRISGTWTIVTHEDIDAQDISLDPSDRSTGITATVRERAGSSFTLALEPSPK
ncbi:polysaccharide lyase family 8 super-sandwich domain-containing protein [Brachybacterium phenoliresistens]|uniref:polysaccharide lyase family 8 super-sandwich domain-containing protein n=1 Tax=Brachybacterium phenoliresistens TaxID=396014 RepID=UPI0031D74BC9